MNLIHRTFLVVLQSRQVSRRSELCEWSRDSNGWIPGSSFCPRTQLWGLCDIPRSQARWGEWDKNKDNRPHLVQVTEGSPVLTNSYTLTPVPGAILHAGGVPVLGRVLDHQQHPLVSCSLQSSAQRRVSKSTWKVWKSSRQLLGHATCSSATWGASYQTWRASSSFAGGLYGDDWWWQARCENWQKWNHRDRDITLVEDCAHVLGSKWRGKALGTRVWRDPSTRPVPNFFSITRPVPTRKLKTTGYRVIKFLLERNKTQSWMKNAAI